MTVWAEGWPALAELIEPLIDKNLRAAATVKRVDDLEVGKDIVIARYRSDLYLKREVEQQSRDALERRGGAVIVGRPKSGKTRLALKLLQERPEAVAIIPHPESSRPPDTFEPSGLDGYETILFFDDIHRTAETTQPLSWRRKFEEAFGNSCSLICTARDGDDWKLVNNKQRLLLDALGQEATVFTSRFAGQGHDLSFEQGRRLAEAAGLSRAEFHQRFDGTPGSLLLNVDDMRRRYYQLRDEQRSGVSMSRLLDSAKLLYVANQPSARAAMLRAVAEEIRGDGPMSTEAWETLGRRTQEEGFAQFDGTGTFSIYRPYLEQCVSYNPSSEDFEQLIPILVREKDADGLFYLGATYGLRMNNDEQALACLELAVNYKPDYPEALNNMGVTLINMGRYREALEVIEKGLGLRPDYLEGRHMKGVALANLERYQEALEAYKWVLSREPNYADAWHNRGVSLSKLGRYEEAVEAYDQSTNRRPDYSEAWYGMGWALHMLGRHEEAADAYDRAIRQGIDDPEAWHNKAVSLERSGRYEEALEAYNQAVTRRPNYAEAWYGKGVSLASLGRYEEALEAYEQTLNYKPDYPEAWTNRGVSLEELGRYEEALAAYDQASVSYKAIFPEALSNKGAVLGGVLGRYEEALETFNRASKVKPDDPGISYNKAMALDELEHYEEAIEAYNRVLALRPDHVDAWHNKGVSLARLERYEEALEAVDQTINLQPNYYDAWTNKAVILRELNRHQEAIEALRKAQRLKPSDLEA